MFKQFDQNMNKQKKTDEHSDIHKIYRLYSPTNNIRDSNGNGQHQKKFAQKSVIQLIFPHPNLLFIHPHKIQDPAEKHAFIELNMIKKIVERKQNQNFKDQTNRFSKPMTAPNMSRKNFKNINMSSAQTQQKQDIINVCNLICNNENDNCDSYSSNAIWCKPKTLTSKTKFRKTNTTLKQNEEFNNQISFKNKMINRNTYDFILDEKKKAIKSKFEKDRISREHFYKQSLESPKTQLYINIEGKFIKYFNNH